MNQEEVDTIQGEYPKRRAALTILLLPTGSLFLMQLMPLDPSTRCQWYTTIIIRIRRPDQLKEIEFSLYCLKRLPRSYKNF